MPFRRRSARRSFPRRRRFGGGIRRSTEPTRWEVANFFFDSADLLVAPLFLTESVELLKVQDHMGGAPGTPVGRSLSAATRRIELGGIVFSYGHSLIGGAGESDNPANLWLHALHLVTDRLDADAQPIALPDWSINQPPIATIPSVDSIEADFPMRIHWRDRDIQANFAGLVSTPSTNATTRSNHPQRTVSLRLRRFLDDQQGLYFQFFDQFAATADEELTIHKWVWGTLYYRWRFT